MSSDIEGRLERLRREVEELKAKGEVVVSEKLANPAPLGLAGFGITTLLLNVVNAGIIPKDSIGMVLPVGLFYGGLAQFMAGMWEAKKNNTFGFTAFSSYGAFWMAFALMELLAMNGVVQPIPKGGLTVFLVAWGIFSTYMFIGTIKISVALQITFAGVAALFYLLAIGVHNTDVHKFAGYEGLFTAGAALYASAAQVINEAWGKNMLPLGIIKK
jgi:uncharacterized protein